MPSLDDYIEPFLAGYVTVFDFLALIDRIYELGREHELYPPT